MKLKIQIVIKPKNSNSDQTKKNSKCDKIPKLKLW